MVDVNCVRRSVKIVIAKDVEVGRHRYRYCSQKTQNIVNLKCRCLTGVNGVRRKRRRL